MNVVHLGEPCVIWAHIRERGASVGDSAVCIAFKHAYVQMVAIAAEIVVNTEVILRSIVDGRLTDRCEPCDRSGSRKVRKGY